MTKEEEKAAEAKKVADAAKAAEDKKAAAEKKAAEAIKAAKLKEAEELKAKQSEKAKRLATEGFHNCTKVELERKNGVIVSMAKTGKKIKAMHESNIDEFNAQQHNTGLFIKKNGKKYELVDVEVPGRKAPLKMFMEKIK